VREEENGCDERCMLPAAYTNGTESGVIHLRASVCAERDEEYLHGELNACTTSGCGDEGAAAQLRGCRGLPPPPGAVSGEGRGGPTHSVGISVGNSHCNHGKHSRGQRLQPVCLRDTGWRSDRRTGVRIPVNRTTGVYL
jgi:hypothetical protein